MTIQLGRQWRRPVVGAGGFQTLLRALQPLANDRGRVVLDARVPAQRELLERVERYLAAYGAGGFQRRIGRLVS